MLSKNVATGLAGGGYLAGHVAMNKTPIERSTASRAGGGLVLTGQGQLENIPMSKNSADSGDGGGIQMQRAAMLWCRNCTIAENSAGGAGGGVAATGACSVLFSKSTFHGNTARTGGGMSAVVSSVQIQDSTFIANAAELGGGLYWFCSQHDATCNSTNINSTTLKIKQRYWRRWCL